MHIDAVFSKYKSCIQSVVKEVHNLEVNMPYSMHLNRYTTKWISQIVHTCVTIGPPYLWYV